MTTSAYPELFMRLGYTFGGKQSLGTFGVADLRGKAPPNLHYLVCASGAFPIP